MKLRIFSIVVACCAVRVSADAGQDTSAALTSRVSAALPKLQAMKTNVDSNVAKIDSSDFGLKQQSKISSIQSALDAKKGKSGVQQCTSTFDTGFQATLQELKTMAKTNLGKTSHALDDRIKKLTDIQKNMSQEVQNCQTAGNPCKITGEYTSATAKAELMIKNNFQDLSSPNILSIFATQSLAKISPKIDDLNKKVTTCLAPL